MFRRRSRRAKALTAVDLTLRLNEQMRSSRRQPDCPVTSPPRRPEAQDLQRPLTEVHLDQALVLERVSRLARTARSGDTSDHPDNRELLEALDWAVYLTGQAAEALQLAALATCPDRCHTWT
ncbi:hypothetical protein [Kitasatospora sp. GP82]|uniref:hypothetical protein n=1 Tax=Kitasatospora sp. GP82 TaxID=3035089 RepID=UPI0024735407|nr:hypothetical protein [Kitasatospora sp. GP82]MDH6129390.1 hypothetical protein [Kitasatospora sp. GP82]